MQQQQKKGNAAAAAKMQCRQDNLSFIQLQQNIHYSSSAALTAAAAGAAAEQQQRRCWLHCLAPSSQHNMRILTVCSPYCAKHTVRQCRDNPGQLCSCPTGCRPPLSLLLRSNKQLFQARTHTSSTSCSSYCCRQPQPPSTCTLHKPYSHTRLPVTPSYVYPHPQAPQTHTAALLSY
jgi:hypothetical protein